MVLEVVVVGAESWGSCVVDWQARAKRVRWSTLFEGPCQQGIWLTRTKGGGHTQQSTQQNYPQFATASRYPNAACTPLALCSHS